MELESNIKEEIIHSIKDDCKLCNKGSEIEWRLQSVEAEVKKMYNKEECDIKDLNIKWNELTNLLVGTLITAVMTLIGVVALFLKG